MEVHTCIVQCGTVRSICHCSCCSFLLTNQVTGHKVSLSIRSDLLSLFSGSESGMYLLALAPWLSCTSCSYMKVRWRVDIYIYIAIQGAYHGCEPVWPSDKALGW